MSKKLNEESELVEAAPTSPRRVFIKKKFENEFKESEEVSADFMCRVAAKPFSLSGMLYVTNRAVYFYTPFHAKTLIGGGSKIYLPHRQIKTIKKENQLLVFKTALRIVLKSGQEILF